MDRRRSIDLSMGVVLLSEKIQVFPSVQEGKEAEKLNAAPVEKDGYRYSGEGCAIFTGETAFDDSINIDSKERRKISWKQRI